VAQARAELEAGHLDQAARIAERAVLADPENGDAHLVLGLARYRTGRYDEAVDAFEAAGHAARPVPNAVVEFNKGSALFKAGQFEPAESCFLAAAADQRMAALATLNAAYAALNSSSTERARELLASAERQPRAADLSSALQDLRAEIKEEEYRQSDVRVQRLRTAGREAMSKGQWQKAIAGYTGALDEARRLKRPNAELGELTYAIGVAQYRGGYFVEARKSFSAAAALSPYEGEFELMAAVTAVRLDEKASARREFEEAVRRGLSPENAELLRGYVDALMPGLSARGRGVSVSAAAAMGYDSNVAQSGVGPTETIANTGASPFAEAALDVAWRFPVTARGFAELAYNFDQTAMFETDLDNFSLQQHTAELTGEFRATPWLRLSLLTGGDLLFAGLSHFSPFQTGLQLRPMIGIDEADRVATRIELERSWKHALDDNFRHLGGVRTDLTIAQDLGIRRARFSLGYRRRYEDLPTAERLSLTALPNLGMIAGCMQDADCVYFIPYDYTSHAVVFRTSVALPQLTRILLSLSFERRNYGRDSFIQTLIPMMELPPGDQHLRRRRDHRFGASLALAVARGTSYDVTARYDVIINRSNIDNSVMSLDYDNKNFAKHVVTVELASDWVWGR
jgi:tetratricopeptide (TPR) repeat protein